MELRGYQREAVGAVWNHIRTRSGNALAVLPTGAGKSVVLSQIAKDVIAWQGRVVMLSHVKELVSQVADHIRAVAPEVHVGIYSAGLKSKDLGYPVTVAGIQSAVNAAEEFGAVDIICIDEVHRVPPDGEGQYRTFLETAKKLNPNVRLIGLTATPYRLASGMICGKDQLFEDICYQIGVRQLIVEGYLSPLKSKTSEEGINLDGVHIRGGEFIQSELQEFMLSDEARIARACSEITERAESRKAVLVFCTGIEHANTVAMMLRDIVGNDAVKTIFGDTPSDERAATIADFRADKLKYLVNVDVLTTGFDAPGVDCVAVLRPTMSPGLFYQMCGRGFRLAPDKKDCLILDFGGNLLRHGPVDRLIPGGSGRDMSSDPWKKCHECHEVVARTCDVCPDCGAVFPKQTRERHANHDQTASGGNVLSEPEPVAHIGYRKHTKKDAPEGHPPTLRVTYTFGLTEVSEFVCLQHYGFARDKAVRWWKERSVDEVPNTIDQALELIYSRGIREPKRIVLEPEGKYLRVVRVLDLEHRRPAKPEEVPF